ncbi:MAG: YdcF family protein [Candidatus Acidiferrum sp.]
MITQNSPEIVVLKKRRVARIAVSLLTAAVLGAALFLLCIGRWLVVQDPLEKAQAIAVLSGRMPIRAMEAAKLYREGYAPEVWLTYSSEPEATLRAMGISYAGEDVYNMQVLMHEGVPAGVIHLLQPPIVNTADEITAISAAMAAQKYRTVILVTSKVHTRRARILWNHLAANQGKAIIRAASEDPFEPSHWWRTTSDALDVVRECLGILNAWAGTPIHAAN